MTRSMTDASANLLALVGAIPVDKLRFLTADRRRAYRFRSLLEAVKVHELRSGRARKLLTYRISRPATDGPPAARARFALPDGCLDAPDLLFARAGRGAHRG